MLRALPLAALGACAASGPRQCADPSREGCALPSGPNWAPRWSMRGSLYTYCYDTCPVASFVEHAAAGRGRFEGVVATDHYWTKQGMPCVGGVPQEFAAQDAWARYLKATFPRARTLTYRIGTAVPYAEIVHTAMVDHPEWFVRWHHAPQANGSVCVCPPEHETGRPGDNCSWPIAVSEARRGARRACGSRTPLTLAHSLARTRPCPMCVPWRPRARRLACTTLARAKSSPGTSTTSSSRRWT